MKIVEFCSKCSKCPVIKLYDDKVEIGEEGNLCVLTMEQWEDLKKKVLDKEV